MADPSLSNDVLRVEIERVVTVYPARPTPEEPLFLSNIDQTVAFPVETVYVFRGGKGGLMMLEGEGRGPSLFGRMEGALRELLAAYYPLAGRLRFNAALGRLEVDCNGAGIPFTIASSPLALDDVGELGFVNPGFRALIPQPPPSSYPFPPLVMMQVTSFKCGGFALGLCTSHSLLDGLSTTQFLHNFASLTKGEGIIFQPNLDRSSLKARDPPTISYGHLELLKLEDSINTTFTSSKDGTESAFSSEKLAMVSQLSSQYLYRSFPFTSSTLQKLKQKALEDGAIKKCSTFDVILAHVWQARTKSIEILDPEKPNFVLFAIDIRKKVNPQLPSTFCGNGVITAYAYASTFDIRSNPLSFCVKKIQEGIERVTSDYIRSAIDWLEVFKGVPAISVNGNFYVSAWWKLTFHKLNFGWGEPVYAGPVMGGVVDMVLLVSNCDNKDEGLNLLLALQPNDMLRFESYVQII